MVPALVGVALTPTAQAPYTKLHLHPPQTSRLAELIGGYRDSGPHVLPARVDQPSLLDKTRDLPRGFRRVLETHVVKNSDDDDRGSWGHYRAPPKGYPFSVFPGVD